MITYIDSRSSVQKLLPMNLPLPSNQRIRKRSISLRNSPLRQRRPSHDPQQQTGKHTIRRTQHQRAITCKSPSPEPQERHRNEIPEEGRREHHCRKREIELEDVGQRSHCGARGSDPSLRTERDGLGGVTWRDVGLKEGDEVLFEGVNQIPQPN